MKCLVYLIGVVSCLFTGRSPAAESPAPGKRAKAEHVVVVVWDGMRPDFITPQYAPTLYELASNGVFFKNHHSVYVTSTEVNGTAMATGVHPIRSGIMANSEYRPEIGWLGPNATEGVESIRRGDLISDGNYIRVPTVAEILQKAGMPTVIAGTKPVALLHDRSLRRTAPAAAGSVTLYNGRTIPRAALDALVKVNEDKQFTTNKTYPNTTQDGWTTKALTHGLWRKGVPKFTLLWLSEPDASQHETGVGSDTALSGIDTSDKNLAQVLKALEEKNVRDKTDVFIVSDHGFSTIRRWPDVTAILKKSKFKATKKFEDPEPGDVMVVGLGGSVSLYVFDDDEPVIRRLVEFLQTTDFAGVIFSRLPIEGTFPLDRVRNPITNGAPDLLVSMRWSADKNEHGVAGMLVSEGGTKGKGSHASLSRFEVNNTLVAAGPDFKKGMIDELPTGNADLAPTILHLLGVPQPSSTPMDGRVLHEALVNGSPPKEKPVTKTIEASRDVGFFRWRQYLKYTEYAGAIYIDEGNGDAVLKGE